MPEPPPDLTEFSKLKPEAIVDLLRRAGVQYQGPAPRSVLTPEMQQLMHAVPTAAAGGVAATTGMGLLGMLAALLAQGGSSRVGGLPTEPDVAARRTALLRARQPGPVPQMSEWDELRRLRPELPAEPPFTPPFAP